MKTDRAMNLANLWQAGKLIGGDATEVALSLRDEVLRLRSAITWQPIETAPKDNARPLYLARFDEDGRLRELSFDGVWEYWQENWELAHINGWAWASSDGIEEPTHWAYQDAGAPPADSSPGEGYDRDLLALVAAARALMEIKSPLYPGGEYEALADALEQFEPWLDGRYLAWAPMPKRDKTKEGML